MPQRKPILNKGRASAPASAPARIPMAISVRHVHLTQASVEALFGAGHILHAHSPLSQPGQYAAEEVVTLIGPKGRLTDVRVVGPPRAQDQVELAHTDEIALGVDAPLRESGDLADTPGSSSRDPRQRHPAARVICALRHIHMSPRTPTCSAQESRRGCRRGDGWKAASDIRRRHRTGSALVPPGIAPRLRRGQCGGFEVRIGGRALRYRPGPCRCRCDERRRWVEPRAAIRGALECGMVDEVIR